MVTRSFTYNGKRYFARGKTVEEAIEKRLKLKLEVESENQIINENTTVEAWSKEWLETYKNGSSDRTYKMYEQKINLHILPYIGSMQLKDIRQVHLQKLLNRYRGKSKSQVDKIHLTLKQLFDKAVKNKLIQYNPADDLDKPPVSEGKHRSITDYERKMILAVAETHKTGLWIKTMLYCGLRPAETAALLWEDVDLKNRTISISKALESGSNKIKSPKTKSGVREVPIPAILLDEFKKKQRSQREPVFTQLTNDRPLTQTALRQYWLSFKRDLDIAMGAKTFRNKIIESKVAHDLVPYCLRHTYCTDLQDAGIALNVAKYLMGHSDISVTANIYTHTSKIVLLDAEKSINSHVTKSVTKNETEPPNPHGKQGTA